MERVSFQNPAVQVEVEPGRGLLVQDLGAIPAADGGCVLELSLRLSGVCPDARTALALTLTELDKDGLEYPRGLRTLLVEAHHGPDANDVAVEAVRFPLPRALDVSGGGIRRFLVRVDAQCVDCHSVCRLRT